MAENMIHATINGKPVEIENGATILKAAEKIGITIPTFCYIKDLDPEGSCRMCLVEIEGNPKLFTACSTPIAEGNVIYTESERVIEARKFVLDLLLSKHNTHCFSCPQNGECKLQQYSYEYGIEQTSFPNKMVLAPIDDSNPYFTYDPNLCILCHRCVNTCKSIVGRGAISTVERGYDSCVANPFYKRWIDNEQCEFCGNCVQACPVGALSTKNHKRYRVWEVEKVQNKCYNCKNNNGCERYLLIKNGEIVDVEAKMDEPNRGRICNRGRFEFYDVERPEQVVKIQEQEREQSHAALLKDLGVKAFKTPTA